MSRVLSNVRLGKMVNARLYDQFLHCRRIELQFREVLQDDPGYADIYQQLCEITKNKVREVDYHPGGVGMMFAELESIKIGDRQYVEIFAPKIGISMTMRPALIEKVDMLLTAKLTEYNFVAIRGDGVFTNDEGKAIR